MCLQMTCVTRTTGTCTHSLLSLTQWSMNKLIRRMSCSKLLRCTNFCISWPVFALVACRSHTVDVKPRWLHQQATQQP